MVVEAGKPRSPHREILQGVKAHCASKMASCDHTLRWHVREGWKGMSAVSSRAGAGQKSQTATAVYSLFRWALTPFLGAESSCYLPERGV